MDVRDVDPGTLLYRGEFRPEHLGSGGKSQHDTEISSKCLSMHLCISCPSALSDSRDDVEIAIHTPGRQNPEIS
jgi:hypothetical protein